MSVNTDETVSESEIALDDRNRFVARWSVDPRLSSTNTDFGGADPGEKGETRIADDPVLTIDPTDPWSRHWDRHGENLEGRR